MTNNPCDIYDYNSDEYNSCVKDVVYEAAQDEWIMLDPRFPNLKGVTPERIDQILIDAKRFDFKNYFEDYLQHVMVYGRDDIFKMCINLGEKIEKKYPGKLHDTHSIFVTTPRGGHEVLSIFAYANDLDKEQIPSHIRSITEEENNKTIELIKFFTEIRPNITNIKKLNEQLLHYDNKNFPVIPDIWLEFNTNYYINKIETIFIIDDIIASGDQMYQAYKKVNDFFKHKIKIIPIVLVKRKNIEEKYGLLSNTIYDTETVGLLNWDLSRDLWKYPEKLSFHQKQTIDPDAYNSLITVRFPWGSPDGDSDKILTKLYEGRRGIDRIERKQERCILEPDKCELK